jgi:hypothetical protein
MTMHEFSSFNQAQAIADKYARATKRTMYVVYEVRETDKTTLASTPVGH